MTATPAKKSAKRRARPVWLRVQTLVDPATGEEIPAFVPAHQMDRDECRRRKYKRGLVLKGELKQRRNPAQWRLLHALGKHVATTCDGFDLLAASEDWHGVVKQLQRESGVACETVETDVPGLGTLHIRQAQSLAFDELPQEEFDKVFRGLSMHVAQRYFPDMSPQAVEEAAKMLARPEDSLS